MVNSRNAAGRPAEAVLAEGRRSLVWRFDQVDLTSLVQQISAAITGLVPASFSDFLTQIWQFFAGLLPGFGW